jgi:hypothetical protein
LTEQEYEAALRAPGPLPKAALAIPPRLEDIDFSFHGPLDGAPDPAAVEAVELWMHQLNTICEQLRKIDWVNFRDEKRRHAERMRDYYYPAESGIDFKIEETPVIDSLEQATGVVLAAVGPSLAEMIGAFLIACAPRVPKKSD